MLFLFRHAHGKDAEKLEILDDKITIMKTLKALRPKQLIAVFCDPHVRSRGALWVRVNMATYWLPVDYCWA